MNLSVTFCLTSMIVMSCASADLLQLTEGMRPASNPEYGYRAEDPIKIGHWDFGESMKAENVFMSMLRGKNGEPLDVLLSATVEDPRGSATSSLPKRFESNVGGGLLDAYTAVIVGTQDTITLYFDAYHDSTLAIPLGLTVHHVTGTRGHK